MYIYQSLATSILYTIKFLNILTSPSMCKQEDYLKKLIYMHNKKKYISMSCKHREAQAVQSFGIRDNRALQSHISDWKLLFKPAIGLQSKTKSYPYAMYVGSTFPLEIKIWLNWCFSPCWYQWVGGGENEVTVTEKRSGRRSQLLKCAPPPKIKKEKKKFKTHPTI